MELSFGKYKGLKVNDPEVPSAYLEWLRDVSQETVKAIDAELTRREQEEAENVTLAERVIRSGYRTLAKEYKDSASELRELEGARAVLEEVLEQYLETRQKKVQQIQPKSRRNAG